MERASEVFPDFAIYCRSTNHRA